MAGYRALLILVCVAALAACVPQDGWYAGDRTGVGGGAGGSGWGDGGGDWTFPDDADDEWGQGDDDDGEGDGNGNGNGNGNGSGDDDDAFGDDDDGGGDGSGSGSGDDDDAFGDDDDDGGDGSGSGSGSGDDDDAFGDDDDSDSSGGGDDDDAFSDDDDASGDDDDDDDDTGAIISFDAPVTDFGATPLFVPLTLPISVSSSGGSPVPVQLVITTTSIGSWSVEGGDFFTVSGGETVDRAIQFNPQIDGVLSAEISIWHEGDNASPLSVFFTGTGGADTGEDSCSDGIDNDGNGDVDCDDFDCFGDPSCNNADFCCSAGSTGDISGFCDTSTAASCVCAADSFCCSPVGGWDQDCVDLYVTCGATCE